ncbi:hypothetical protein J6590_089384, partial [Homalodisca vitripennis]
LDSLNPESCSSEEIQNQIGDERAHDDCFDIRYTLDYKKQCNLDNILTQSNTTVRGTSEFGQPRPVIVTSLLAYSDHVTTELCTRVTLSVIQSGCVAVTPPSRGTEQCTIRSCESQVRTTQTSYSNFAVSHVTTELCTRVTLSVIQSGCVAVTPPSRGTEQCTIRSCITSSDNPDQSGCVAVTPPSRGTEQCTIRSCESQVRTTQTSYSNFAVSHVTTELCTRVTLSVIQSGCVAVTPPSRGTEQCTIRSCESQVRTTQTSYSNFAVSHVTTELCTRVTLSVIQSGCVAVTPPSRELCTRVTLSVIQSGCVAVTPPSRSTEQCTIRSCESQDQTTQTSYSNFAVSHVTTELCTRVTLSVIQSGCVAVTPPSRAQQLVATVKA